MTGDAFSALERRLLAVSARPSLLGEPRGDLLRLLDECRALRAFAPPALAALERISWVFETLDSLRAEAGPDERLARKLRHHLATARGHLLAALGARPPGVEADHEAGDRQLDWVLRDGAELERLRKPPDVSGLMPAAELAAVKESFARDVYPRPDEVAALFAHLDALESLVRELYGVVADLHADDPGRQALLERGRAEGRDQVWKLLVEYGAPPTDGAISADEFEARHGKGGLGDAIRSLGPSRPPLPPHAAEAQAGRLREALRGLLAAAGKVNVALGPDTPAWFDGLTDAYAAARAALGEDA